MTGMNIVPPTEMSSLVPFRTLKCKGPFTQAIFVAQFNAIFVALKLQLENSSCKPAAISVQFLCNLSPRFAIQLTKHGDIE